MAKEHLKSRLGFILISAGCAIGIGNVWKFPYITGQNGGGLFVLIYLFFLAVLGIPVLVMEFSLGRASQKSPSQMYKVLEPKNSKWHLHGYVTVIGCYLLMMFYTTVAGWMLDYFVKMTKGDFVDADTSKVNDIFGDMLANPTEQTIFMAITVILAVIVCSIGLQKGLEKVTKVIMVALLGIMVILAINSIFLPGSKEGLSFYLLPSVKNMTEVGVGNVIVAAMNQAFFTLSLGIGSMAIFGSYIGKDRSLLGESINITVLDTFVAITSGLIIFPACFTYNIPVDAGPNLIFVTLPNVFINMPGGRIWGSLFFLFMTFAAFSTVLAVFQNIVANTQDTFGWSLKKSCLINGVLLLVLSMPCILGFNLLSGFQPLGSGSTILDLEDFIVSNVLLPLGSFIFVIFCTTRYGWGWKNFKAEANAGKGLRIKNWMRGYMTYVLPVIVLALFIVGIVNVFKK